MYVVRLKYIKDNGSKNFKMKHYLTFHASYK